MASASDEVGDGDALRGDGRLRQQPEGAGQFFRRMVCTSFPSSSTTPPVGLSSRDMDLRSVDLPQAFAPMMPVTLPGRTDRSMPWMTAWSA
jgi:hypothetical protein